MLQANDAARIDQHVAPQLIWITLRTTQLPAPQQQSDVHPNAGRAIDIPPLATIHPIRRVKPARLVHDDRPLELRLLDIRLHERAEFERDDDHANVLPFEFRLDLPQLRQMFTAGESAQMSMEHQQQPVAGIVRQRVDRPLGVGEREWHGGHPDSATHRVRVSEHRLAGNRRASQRGP